jgi:betaine reductase
MVPIAGSIWGQGRRVTGVSVLHPVGEPQLSAEQEAELRYRLVLQALASLEAGVPGESPTATTPATAR